VKSRENVTVDNGSEIKERVRAKETFLGDWNALNNNEAGLFLDRWIFSSNGYFFLDWWACETWQTGSGSSSAYELLLI
jgi:hypothetical protein